MQLIDIVEKKGIFCHKKAIVCLQATQIFEGESYCGRTKERHCHADTCDSYWVEHQAGQNVGSEQFRLVQYGSNHATCSPDVHCGKTLVLCTISSIMYSETWF